MKKFGIIVAILGILLFAVSSFFYKTTSNAVDGTRSQKVETDPNNTWTYKLPLFAGGAIFVIGIIFFAASGPDNQRNNHLI
jgi:uncharacterized membrane protein